MKDKFSVQEATMLRNELLRSGMDFFQVAETIRLFLAEHGYGISSELAWDVATRLDGPDRTAESFHRQLETMALAM